MKIEDEIQQEEFKSPVQKASINLLFSAGWLLNRHKEFFKPFGVTTQQYNVLRILRGAFPRVISTSMIKSRMLDRNSDASRIIDRLDLKGLVIKKTCSKDRRLLDIKISNKGLKLLDNIDKEVDQLDFTLGTLTYQEANQLSDLLDKVREHSDH